MTPLQRTFLRIGAELGVEISFDKAINIEGGANIVAPVYMPRFGSPHGILIFETSADVWPRSSAIVALGYAYSVLGPCSPDNIDMVGIEEMLEEWGCGGAEDQKPTWFGRSER